MELIVTSFLLTGLSLFGHIGTVIAEQLRRPKRRVFRIAVASHDPPPPSRRAPKYLFAVAQPVGV